MILATCFRVEALTGSCDQCGYRTQGGRFRFEGRPGPPAAGWMALLLPVIVWAFAGRQVLVAAFPGRCNQAEARAARGTIVISRLVIAAAG